MSMTEHAAGHLPPPRLIRILRMVGLLRASPVAMIGAGLIVFWIAAASFAPLLAPFDPNANLQPFAKPGAPYAAGSGGFCRGAAHVRRDIRSRGIWGSRPVLFSGFAAAASADAVRRAMGLAAGYYRGWIDDLLSRLGGIVLSFPILVLCVV